jgi:hypothetical protein
VTLVLVVGSYPPIPVPGVAATLDAVRSVWEHGDEVHVVSPRPSAAHYASPIVGWLAGRRLRRLRQVTGATELVFCVEPGVPFDPLPEVRPRGERQGWGPAAWLRSGPVGHARARLAARLLARSMRGFQHTTLVLTADAAGPPAAIATLRRAADTVVEDRRPGRAAPTVTVRGPRELTAVVRLRQVVNLVAYRLLGHRWASVRRSAAGGRRRLRREIDRHTAGVR